jgi:septal ring-binding cell division protein DamX
MARRMADRRSPGLTFGQLITLTFGFLLASVVIFVFGFWVGRDLAEQQAAKQRDVARVPIAPPEPEPSRPAPVARPPVAAATRPPVAVVVAPTNTPLPASTPTAVMIVRIASTATAVRLAAATPASGTGSYTVQAYATNDMMRAVMLSKTLQGKGYAAATATTQIGGATWYVVRVGRFRDRTAAKAMETKLRSEEGLEAASVTAQ